MQLSIDLSLNAGMDIFLKIVKEEDVDTLFALVEANRDHLRQFLGWVDSNTSRLDSLAFIRGEIAKLKQLETATFAIYYVDSLAGLISLHNIDHLNRSANIGYWIAKKHQGKGLILKSTKAVIQYAFQELKIHRIEIRCATHNLRSQKIPEILGFVKEDTLREAIACNNKYFDAHVYGLLRDFNY